MTKRTTSRREINERSSSLLFQLESQSCFHTSTLLYLTLPLSVLPKMVKLSLSTVIAVYNLLAVVVISNDAIEDLDKAILDDIIQSYSTHEPSTCTEEQASSTLFTSHSPAPIPNQAGIPTFLATNKVFSKPSYLTMIPLAKTCHGQSESVLVGTCTASSNRTYLAKLSLPRSTSMRHGSMRYIKWSLFR